MAKGPGSLLGQTLGQFQIKEELGRGGMAVVYKGYQQSLDRWVAIKTLPIELAADREMVSRFHREAEAMVSLNHTNIVQIIDKGEDKGCYYFAMEFVGGPSLKDMLKETELSIDLLFEVSIQVCEGLGYAHKKGIIHRDIKPANILWETGTSLAKVADFGIARVNNKELEMITLTANNVGMGTMNYMSPEQKTDAKAVDHRADIYSLGVMIYEMFTGKLPLGKFKMPAELNPKLPKKLDEVLSKCLETDPADRWQTMDELRAGLTEARAQAKGGTLVRSVRDAAERTLTAMKGGGGGGKVVAGLLGCTVLLGGLAAGGFAVKKFVIDKPTGLAIGTETGTSPPGTDTGTKPPGTDTGTKPPNPTTGTKPPGTDTGARPPQTDTGAKPPGTDTGAKPPQTDTGAKPPVTETATETGPSPTTAELSAGDARKFDDAREKLDALLTTVTDEGQRSGIAAALTAALDGARKSLEAAEQLRGQGKPASIERLRDASRKLQDDASSAFADATRQRIAEAGAAIGPDQRARVDEAQKEYDEAADKRGEDQIRSYADALVKARRALLDGSRSAARLTLAMAATRAPKGQQLDEARKAFDDAVALERSKPAEALVLLRTATEKALAVRGTAVKGLKAVGRLAARNASVLDASGGFYSICAGPGGRIAAIGLKGGQNMLCIYEVNDGQLVAVAPPRSIEEQGKFVKPRYVASAGEGAFWVANLNRVRRIQADGKMDLELTAPDAPLFDIEAGPDGALWVAGTRTVTRFDPRTFQPTNVAQIPDRTFTPYFDVPRRLVCLSRGWVLSGETGHADSPTSGDGKKAAQDQVWQDELADGDAGWRVSLRYGLDRGPVASFRSARGLEPLAIAVAGNGLLACDHAPENAEFYLFPEDLSAPPTTPLAIAGSPKMKAASDLAITGGHAVLLHWRAPSGDDPGLRLFMDVFELVP